MKILVELSPRLFARLVGVWEHRCHDVRTRIHAGTATAPDWADSDIMEALDDAQGIAHFSRVDTIVEALRLQREHADHGATQEAADEHDRSDPDDLQG